MKFNNILRASVVLLSLLSSTMLTSHQSLSNPNCKNEFKLTPRKEDLEFSRGKVWRTCSGYRFALQNDGNLILYNRSDLAIWSVSSYKKGDVFSVQRDGNSVLYRRGSPLWSTGTDGNRGASFVIQGDGNLVVYSRRGAVLWSSNTAGK